MDANAHRDFEAFRERHEEAHKQHDLETKRHREEMKAIRETQAATGEYIRALERRAGLRRGLDNLEGGVAS